jgi:hypothetical protein
LPFSFTHGVYIEVDIKKGEMDDFVRLVRENWGASADQLNQLLREKRDDLG